MNNNYGYPITTNSVIMSLTQQIEGLTKQRKSLLEHSIYCPICNKYYDKDSECISAGMEKKKLDIEEIQKKDMMNLKLILLFIFVL